MTIDQTLQIVQVAYPQVYLACHTQHQRKRSTVHHLSARDSAILSHLDSQTLTTPSRLATHLSIGRSTLSEALTRLAELGFVEKVARPPKGNRRGGVGVRLTEKGRTAIRETSVLEEPKLRAVMERLSTAERRAVGRGMQLLADACRRTSEASAKS